MTHDRRPPGLDLFWEQADIEESGDHPLMRELHHRVDAIARYQSMIAEAESMGLDSVVAQLVREREREEALARDLRDALRTRH